MKCLMFKASCVWTQGVADSSIRQTSENGSLIFDLIQTEVILFQVLQMQIKTLKSPVKFFSRSPYTEPRFIWLYLFPEISIGDSI